MHHGCCDTEAQYEAESDTSLFEEKHERLETGSYIFAYSERKRPDSVLTVHFSGL